MQIFIPKLETPLPIFKFFFFNLQKKKKKARVGISATLRIGQKILCLPYAGLFMFTLERKKTPCFFKESKNK